MEALQRNDEREAARIVAVETRRQALESRVQQRNQEKEEERKRERERLEAEHETKRLAVLEHARTEEEKKMRQLEEKNHKVHLFLSH